MTYPALILALLLAVPTQVGSEGSASLVNSERAERQPTEAPANPQHSSPPAQSVDEQETIQDIVVTGRPGAPKGDPLERANIVSYEVTQAIDGAIVRPVAKTYQRILPDPVRSGIRNIINNLREPVVFLNFLLQLKPGKAAETAGRFAINTTIGGAGLFDFAKRRPFHLPRRANGLANTLGFYGVKPGPFLFVPIVGPTTLRDVIGDTLDRLVLPLAVSKPFNQPIVGVAIYAVSTLDQRAEFDETLEEIHKARADPYATTREDYLRNRQAAIDALHGKPPEAEDALPPGAEPPIR